jgi:hypothetical protein
VCEKKECRYGKRRTASQGAAIETVEEAGKDGEEPAVTVSKSLSNPATGDSGALLQNPETVVPGEISVIFSFQAKFPHFTPKSATDI